MLGASHPLTEFEWSIVKRHSACTPLAQLEIEWLRKQGIPSSALAHPDLLLRADVHFRALRFAYPDEIEPDAEMERALILLVRDADGHPHDLAAWAPRSRRLATWCGRAVCIGNAMGPRLNEHGALPVYPSPLEWLQEGCDGIVIIDPVAASHELFDLGPIAAMGGAEHARELKALFEGLAPCIIAGTVLTSAI
ncbi:hypothetical protein ABEG18_08110 [Alsobacter sp. KACC 23698]|uniref:Uncharacterized protein n=1 Tax=Alsobacter sp. KACC 23698 TaxID=3149229 RepID=A0AAU7JKK5_9HYPH